MLFKSLLSHNRRFETSLLRKHRWLLCMYYICQNPVSLRP
ncbi:unnamed protein product [Callosobruchus maculatus]|uniref:Uncharacterized protein n=1 Tax=Callosobruchus maculatus TaxID=64391 RepID=A0A653BUN2_CALMS|nr:unnamed protein product [Callosobruchus maculatus]